MERRMAAPHRQLLIAEAVVRVLAAGGFEAATVRTVAAEAGVSAGAVQAQFPTKDALLLAGCGLVVDRYLARTDPAPAPSDPREAVRDLLLESLPLDEVRRAEARVWSALTDRATRSQPVAEVVRHVDVLAQQDLTARLTAAGVANPVVGATVLLAVCDGLATRLAYEPGFGTEAHRALDAALELVWAGSRAVAVT